jgi:hypothetical protein
VIDLGGGVFERRSNIVRFKVGKISEYLFFRSTAGEHVEDVFDADSHPANARTAATLTRVRGDPI